MDLFTLIYVSCIIFIIFGFSAAIANVTQFILLFRDRREITVFQMTLLSLAVVDFVTGICYGVVGSILLPQAVKRVDDLWRIGASLWLTIVKQLKDYCVMISLFHILFIAVQRYAAVSMPLRYKTLLTKRRTGFILLVVWTAALVVGSIFTFALKDHNKHWVVTAYIIYALGVLLLLLYGLITYRIRQQQKSIRRINATSQDSGFSVKLFVNSFGVTIMFMACMFPIAGSVLEIGKLKNYEILFSSLLAVKAFADPTMYFFASYCKSGCLEERKRRNIQDSNSNIYTLTSTV